jgi:hypothetical protein
MRAVADRADGVRMPVVDYRLFINRGLPIRDRACASNAAAA